MRIIIVGNKGGKRTIRWSGVILAFLVSAISAFAAALLASRLLRGQWTPLPVGSSVVLGFTCVVVVVHKGFRTPVSKLPQID